MQNIDREPLFCTQFAKQKVCPILNFIDFYDKILINLEETYIKLFKYSRLSWFKGFSGGRSYY